MRLLIPALVLLSVSRATRRTDYMDTVFIGRSPDWKTVDKTVFLNADDQTNLFIMHTAVEESWGSDMPPWELVETIEGKCPDLSCNMTISYPCMVQLDDNKWPVPQALNISVEGRFSEEGYLGTKRDMVEIMSLILKSLHDPMMTEYLFYKTVDGENTTSIGYRPVYTAPKALSASVNNLKDDNRMLPYLQVRMDSGRAKRYTNTMCERSRDRAKLMDSAFLHRYGQLFRIYRVACKVPILPHHSNG